MADGYHKCSWEGGQDLIRQGSASHVRIWVYCRSGGKPPEDSKQESEMTISTLKSWLWLSCQCREGMQKIWGEMQEWGR